MIFSKLDTFLEGKFLGYLLTSGAWINQISLIILHIFSPF